MKRRKTDKPEVKSVPRKHHPDGNVSKFELFRLTPTRGQNDYAGWLDENWHQLIKAVSPTKDPFTRKAKDSDLSTTEKIARSLIIAVETTTKCTAAIKRGHSDSIKFAAADLRDSLTGRFNSLSYTIRFDINGYELPVPEEMDFLTACWRKLYCALNELSTIRFELRSTTRCFPSEAWLALSKSISTARNDPFYGDVPSCCDQIADLVESMVTEITTALNPKADTSEHPKSSPSPLQRPEFSEIGFANIKKKKNYSGSRYGGTGDNPKTTKLNVIDEPNDPPIYIKILSHTKFTDYQLEFVSDYTSPLFRITNQRTIDFIDSLIDANQNREFYIDQPSEPLANHLFCKKGKEANGANAFYKAYISFESKKKSKGHRSRVYLDPLKGQKANPPKN